MAFQPGQQVKVTTTFVDGAKPPVTRISEVTGVSRFQGLVCVDDQAFWETGDGRWIAKHNKGGDRNTVTTIEPYD